VTASVEPVEIPPGTRWSIAAGPVDGPAELLLEPDLLLPTASVGKVFLLLELAARLESGALSPDLPVDRRAVDPVADSGLWQHLATDVLPVADAAQLVGTVSDNWATNALLDLVGLGAVQERARSVAPGGSQLLDLVRDRRLAEHPPTLSVGCASDWFPLMSALATGDGLGRKLSLRVLEWLRHGVDHSMVPSAFALDPLAHADPDRGLRAFSKTGTSDGVRADVGVVMGPDDTWAYAALCAWDPAEGDRRDEVLATMRSIGEVVGGHVGGGA
jgi:beta-lactamase class A